MENAKTPFIEDWPRVSLRDFEDVELEGTIPKVLYQSLVSIICLPEKTIAAFVTLLKEKPL